eukprot:TRINITY_DN13229_c0_g1_i1.p1 TRINITY_DN13229_c0_g1~~TRINITY_DN13229_c0_g1_i1.p1  ORF type:complete len:120 (+),score=15.87 TRINITY_DN13229_c0_g1_i1:171-530(+)
MLSASSTTTALLQLQASVLCTFTVFRCVDHQPRGPHWSSFRVFSLDFQALCVTTFGATVFWSPKLGLGWRASRGSRNFRRLPLSLWSFFISFTYFVSMRVLVSLFMRSRKLGWLVKPTS